MKQRETEIGRLKRSFAAKMADTASNLRRGGGQSNPLRSNVNLNEELRL